MKKTTFLPVLGLILVSAALLTAFTVKKVFLKDPEVTFQEFLEQFPKQRLPYALDEKSLKARLDQYLLRINSPEGDAVDYKTRRLDWQYFEFLPDLQGEASFSRVPLQCEPIAMFATADNFAVLYGTSRSFRGGYATYYISVFDKKGHQVSSNMIGKVMPETIGSASISSTLQAELKTWRIEWKKNYADNGTEGNKIKGLTQLETESIDLMKPTASRPSRFDKRMIAPPEFEEATPLVPDGIKSK